MSFLDREQSNYNGEPILLYEFRRGAIRALYASSDRDVQTSNGVFLACPISNSGMTMKGMAVTDQFEITAPGDVVPAQWFGYTPPSDTVYVIVRRFHWGDPVSAIVYIGQIVTVSEQPDQSVSIKCQPTSITLKRGGLRMTWQRGCVHGLYDQNCTVNKEAYRVDTTVVAVYNNTFAVASQLSATAWWLGGIIQWPVGPGTFERRLIENIDASRTIIAPYGQLDGYVVGMPISLYPGCKRTSAWCDGFFGNLANYGGYQYMPNRSPYNGDTVF